MTIRTLSVAVEAHDTNLDSFAESIDCAVEEACARLESANHVVLGISPVPMVTRQTQFGDGCRDTTSVESGLILLITYRAAGSTTTRD